MRKKMEINQYEDSQRALHALTEDLTRLIRHRRREVFNLALSGGETAKKMFTLWVAEYKDRMDWEALRFFWVDERCVPPADPESNYGQAENLLLSPLQIPEKQIHRIQGENDPGQEALRYAREVRECVPCVHGIPLFEAVILGIGNDLHTASIFPNVPELLTDTRDYAVSRHPVTGQYRVTMTGTLLLSGAPLLVPVLGKGKEQVLEELRKKNSRSLSYPATYILGRVSQATVYLGI